MVDGKDGTVMTDKPARLADPGPTASPAELHAHAQNNARYADWLRDHPEDIEHPAPRNADSGTGPPSSLSLHDALARLSELEDRVNQLENPRTPSATSPETTSEVQELDGG